MDGLNLSSFEAMCLIRSTLDRYDDAVQMYPMTQWEALGKLYRGIPHVRGIAGMWADCFDGD